MTKPLYDPNMFNYMWESIVPGEDFIVGTYYIEDVVDPAEAGFIDHLGQVELVTARVREPVDIGRPAKRNLPNVRSRNRSGPGCWLQTVRLCSEVEASGICGAWQRSGRIERSSSRSPRRLRR